MPDWRGIQGLRVAIGISRTNWMPVGVSFHERLFSAKLSLYQLGSYAVLNWLDDPAWLALVFC